MSKATDYQGFSQRLLVNLKKRRPRGNWRIVDHPVGWNWVAFYRVKYNVWYGVGFTGDGNLRVGLHLGHKKVSDSQRLFDHLYAHKEVIERALGFPLVWETAARLRTQACRLAVYEHGTIYDPPEHLSQLEAWAVDMIISLRTGLTSHLHNFLGKS